MSLDQLLDLQVQREDVAHTFSPLCFDDYLGQHAIKEKLRLYVTASKMRSEALDHLLLFGPPGLGKTTLAQVVAQELGVPCRITSGPVLERSGDLVSMLSNAQEKEIIFIDEIHRMPKVVEETLYSAMENFCVDMMLGQGAGAQSIRLPLNRFTIIGATTKTASLSAPLQTRFGIVERLDYYTAEELAQIVEQNAGFFGMQITQDASRAIGARARGTPRIVKRLLRRVRDYAQVHGMPVIDAQAVEQALQFLGIDEDGLTKLDREVLIRLLVDFDGGPVGLDTLAALTGEDKETLEFYCEPFLMRLGLLQKSSRGRSIPPKKIPYLRRRLLGDANVLQSAIF